MSILPQSNLNITNVIKSTLKPDVLPFIKEYAWDFEKNEFILEDGKPKIVAGIEAIKVWIYKALLTPRFRYMAYTWNYGSEFEDLIGKSLSRAATETECKRYLEEALMINPYIKSISNIKVNLNDSLNIDFTVNTIYGEVNIVV